jgi:coproporphyrinogen III oxidase-like Fe-S oxidoreductase
LNALLAGSANFAEFFQNAPPSVDVEAIRRQWQALKPPYDVNHWKLPVPLWAQRPYDHSGPQAWEVLCGDLAKADPARPFCIYIHVPFCSSKCGFCDSYSFKVGNRHSDRIEGYLDRLCAEIRLWSAQGSLGNRPVSTIHLGGGTPTFLGEAGLARLVECCKENFAISPATEWALESTAKELNSGMIKAMHALGFRRLHMGVQSLEDRVRKVIGRRCPASEVLEKIQVTQALGWIASVDLICGLPYQTLEGFIDGIEMLVGLGVSGFSLYELLIYPQNSKWAANHGLTGRNRVPNYFLFQAGASVLSNHGYGKNVFNHWADSYDRNVYFTFSSRDEDCLAIGAIADGVFGDYHYRHPRYAPYLHAPPPGLEGGLRRSALENFIHPYTTAILSSHVSAGLLSVFQEPGEHGEPALLERWLSNGLVECEAGGGFQLATNGAWFAGDLIVDLGRHIHHTRIAREPAQAGGTVTYG